MIERTAVAPSAAHTPLPRSRPRRSSSAAALALLLTLAGCWHFDAYRRCDRVPEARLARLPPRLSGTGLYAAPDARSLAPGVIAYQPRFELWSDGAEKQRWAQLPAGAHIDTTDPDDWQFPEGTRFWKQFTVDGTAIETRLLQKVGPGPDDWVGAAYLWSRDGSDAVLAPDGVTDALDTRHDVPAAAQCFGCHGGRKSRVLGFSAIQLSAPRPSTSTPQLAALSEAGLFDEPAPPVPELPGDADTRDALGYLHANCGHCHNQTRPPRAGARCFDPERGFDLTLRVAELEDVTRSAAYASTVDGIVIPGDPEHSELYRRLGGGSVFLPRMPPLGSEHVDPSTLARLRAWIAELPSR